MSQKLPVNNFQWIKDISQFNEDFVKSYNEENDEGYFLEVDVQYLEICIFFIRVYYFYQKELKLQKLKTL